MFKNIRLAILALLSCTLFTDLSAQYSLTVEASASGHGHGTVYRFYVDLSDPTDRVSAVFGNDQDNLVINTPIGARARYDEESIGRACIQHGIVAITTLSGANAALRAIRVSTKKIEIDSIQNYYR